MTKANLDLWAPRMLSILRIVVGLLFLEHGTQILLGFPPGEHANIPIASLIGCAGIIEFCTGFLLTIGLFARTAAFLASGTMAFAYWVVHAPQGVFPANNEGDAAILYCFVFLYFVFTGPGPWSVDMRRGA